MICSVSEISEQDRPELQSHYSKIVRGHANKTLRQVDLLFFEFPVINSCSATFYLPCNLS